VLRGLERKQNKTKQNKTKLMWLRTCFVLFSQLYEHAPCPPAKKKGLTPLRHAFLLGLGVRIDFAHHRNL